MVTIKDVAERAGVSYTTVSHVINKTRFVEDVTKKRVLAAIKELDYHPNILARSFKTGKSYTIGLIVSDITNPFFPEIIRGVQTEAFNSNYDIFLSNTDYDPKKTSLLVNRLIEKKVDGAIIATLETDLNLASYLASNKIPVVLLDWGITDYLISNIRENYTNGMKQAIKHLLELGHKNIAFIAGPENFKTANNRKEVFISVANRYLDKISNQTIIEENLRISGGEAAADKILSLPKLPTAVITSSDLLAIGFIRRIKERGLIVPDDISVIGFNDIFLATFIEPPLSTIGVPRYQIGQLAWKLMNHFIKSKNKKGREEVVDTNFVVRKTTAKAKIS